jgi:hypothetical protein
MGAVERAKPPHDLTDEEIVEWVRVVDAEPADHFTPSTLPLLTQYCRHIVSARQAREWRERAENIADLDKCLAMQDRESRALAMLATKMRLSQQSTTNHRGNKIKKPIKKLWD